MTATGSVYVRGDGNTVNEPELPQGDQRETDPGLSELESCAVKVARTVLRGGRSEQSAFPTRQTEYRADAAVCNSCPRKTACTPSNHGRQVHRSFHAVYLDRVRGYHETEEYKKAMRKRKVWIEPLFGEAKQWHGMRQFRLRGLQKVNMEGLLIAAGQNLKRLLSAEGWGRRPWPDGTVGLMYLRVPICFALG